MAYRVVFSKRADRERRNLPVRVQREVTLAADALGVDPRPRGAKQLRGQPGGYRIRVGDYGVVYRIEDDVLLVLVVRVGHRREVYRGL